MAEVSDFYLIFDPTDPSQPRLVVARACVSRPAEAVLDTPDRRDTATGGRTWLAHFGVAGFAWLARIFGRPAAVWVTQPGQECLATRISHHTLGSWPVECGGDYETGWTDDGTRYHYWDDAWDTDPGVDRA